MTEDPIKRLDAAMNAELENGAAVFQTINKFLRLSVSTPRLVTFPSSSKFDIIRVQVGISASSCIVIRDPMVPI